MYCGTDWHATFVGIGQTHMNIRGDFVRGAIVVNTTVSTKMDRIYGIFLPFMMMYIIARDCDLQHHSYRIPPMFFALFANNCSSTCSVAFNAWNPLQTHDPRYSVWKQLTIVMSCAGFVPMPLFRAIFKGPKHFKSNTGSADFPMQCITFQSKECQYLHFVPL